MKKILIGMIAAAFIAVPSAALAQDEGVVDDEVEAPVDDEDDEYVEVAPPETTEPPVTTEPPETTEPPATTVPDESVGVLPPPTTPQRPLPSAGLSTLEGSLRVGALLMIGGLGVVIVARRRRITASPAPVT